MSTWMVMVRRKKDGEVTSAWIADYLDRSKHARIWSHHRTEAGAIKEFKDLCKLCGLEAEK